MAERIVYVSRLTRLPLLSNDGAEIGRLSDVVVAATTGPEAPHVSGFVISVQRRRVFVAAGRIAELEMDGARMRPNTSINPHQFEVRPGELLVVNQLMGRDVRGETVVDVGIEPSPGMPFSWQVATVAFQSGGIFPRRRTPRVVEWDEAPEIFAPAHPIGRQAAAMGLLHPVEMAEAIRALPLERRRNLAAALEDERLADLLEEMTEEEQVRIVEGLDRERAARVLEEMEADDAADLLGEMPVVRRDEILSAMTPDEADPVRRLLAYEANTAGGMMNPEPLIMPPTATVAEALARIRNPEVQTVLGAQVFVTRLPNETPTGRYMGVVGYQRLLREAPSKPLGRCVDDEPEAVLPDASDRDVAARVAAYDAVAVPVVDESGRLLGAVTVDDVLDRVLPRDWRNRGAAP